MTTTKTAEKNAATPKKKSTLSSQMFISMREAEFSRKPKTKLRQAVEKLIHTLACTGQLADEISDLEEVTLAGVRRGGPRTDLEDKVVFLATDDQLATVVDAITLREET